MLAPTAYEGTRTAGYLDTATYGLPPASTLEALERALRGWREWEDWRRWEEDGERCRELFGRIAGAGATDVAILPALSAAAGIVAASLGAGPGDNVVCYEREFRSALFPWLALEARGVEVRLRPLEDLAAAVDERTALVAVSSVQSADGRLADLDALRATGARLFVDGTQSVGALPIDVEGIDYLAAAAYKWLCCPRGLCFLYVAPRRLAEVEPWLAGWKSAPDPYERYYGPPRQLAAGARRLDLSLPWLLAAGARASLELVAELGAERIAAHDLGLARRFCSGAGLPEPASPIVQIAVPDAAATIARLERAGIRCAGRAGALRFAFHLYNDEADVDRALEALGS
jgi:selenocysteine lyase/cysteine desulfurase